MDEERCILGHCQQINSFRDISQRPWTLRIFGLFSLVCSKSTGGKGSSDHRPMDHGPRFSPAKRADLGPESEGRGRSLGAFKLVLLMLSIFKLQCETKTMNQRSGGVRVTPPDPAAAFRSQEDF